LLERLVSDADEFVLRKWLAATAEERHDITAT
jgi:hypothetical protein